MLQAPKIYQTILHKDLEIAAVYEVLVSWGVFMDMLANTGHFEVDVAATTESDSKFRFFVSPNTAGNNMQITRLLIATMGGREEDAEWDGYTS